MNGMDTSEIARFDVLRVLGTGAQGVVVLAHDHADATGEPVGLKILRRVDASLAALERLREEARILAWLDHPNIVRVHRLLEKDGLLILVMDHVDGASALELLAARPEGLPAAVAVEITRRTAMALAAAWTAAGPDGGPMKIVHRDLKPANLLVSVTGEVKVIDFGIALGALIPGATPTFLGTRGYIAPERHRGVQDTPAVDVYGLGATLFALLTGRLLQQSSSALRHAPAVLHGLSFLRPQGVSAAALHALRVTIEEMCLFDPAARPTLGAIEQRLRAVTLLLGGPDMERFAREQVVPLVRKRAAGHARNHPSWPDLAFLEGGGDVNDLGVATPGAARALALREVAVPDHVEANLAALRSTDEPATLACSLRSLRGSRDVRAVTQAHELTRHPDPTVSDAAWELLAAAC